MVGTVLDGRYRILRELGSGGMGEVYLAEHLELGRKQAIKILSHSAATDPEWVGRFRREAKATDRLQHPNIIEIYDFGRMPDGNFFLVMEFADGESLGEILVRDGRLSVTRTLRVLNQLAEAVAHAHRQGVIHRDLKPDNIILLRGDMIKVLDFGMAKIVAPDYQSVGLTRDNEVFGTPQYMAPEQFTGVGSDPRVDIYSMGCVAYALLVGTPPFTGRMMDVMQAHIHTVPPPPSARRREVALFDTLVMRCLAKSADDRYQTAEELLLALGEVDPSWSDDDTDTDAGMWNDDEKTIPADRKKP